MRKVPKCEICGVKPAEFVCRECGRLVCRDHYDPLLGVCSECAKKYYSKSIIRKKNESILPFTLIFFGIFLLLIGFLLISLSYIGYSFKELGDIVVIIGPLPILFAGKIGLVIGIIYFIIILLIFYIIIRKFF